jgi:hypothetical protein
MSDDSQARFRAALRNPDAVEPRPGAMDEHNTMVWFGPAGRMMPLWEARSWTKAAINEMDFPTEPPPEETEQARPDVEEGEGAEEAAQVREVECDDEDEADEETLQEILAAIEALSARMLAVEEARAERRALDAETEAALARQDGPAEALSKIWN